MSTIRFAIIDVLKGQVNTPFVDIRGLVSADDDRNDGPVPYAQIRQGGRGGGCFAFGYRLRADYLLFLRRADHPFYSELNQLTPYWSPLSPTNEQVFGDDDPWTAWVRRELRIPR